MSFSVAANVALTGDPDAPAPAIQSPALECFICRDADGAYCLPTSYRHSLPKILFGNVSEELTKRIIAEHCGGGDIFHAGAYVGDFFPALSKALDDGRACITCEPNPLSHQAAQHTLALNGIRNVTCSPVGLARAPGHFELQIENEDGVPLAQTARYIRDRPAGTGLRIETETIDNLAVDTEVKVLHLDLEGFEFHAMAGAMKTIARDDIVIVIENHQPKVIKTYLSGFTCFGEANNNYFYARRPGEGMYTSLARASLLERGGDGTSAHAVLMQVLEASPDDPLVCEAMMEFFGRNGESVEALRIARRLADEFPHRIAAYDPISKAARSSSGEADLLPVLKTGMAITRHPNCAYGYLLAALRFKLDRDELLAIAQRFRRDFERHAEIALALSKIHAARGELSEAISAIKEAVVLRPDRKTFAEYHESLLLRQAGRLAAATAGPED